MLDLIRRLRIPTPSSRLLRDIHGSLPSLLRTEHRLLSLAGSHGLELQPGEDILQVLARYILDTNPGDVCRCEFLKTLFLVNSQYLRIYYLENNFHKFLGTFLRYRSEEHTSELQSRVDIS